MKTLLKKNHSYTSLVETTLEDCPIGYVTIKVQSVGLCRTDLFVANGTIALDYDVVLGHEFSGTVVQDLSNTYHVGQRVAVNPLYPEKKFMGLDFNGALTEYIHVPLAQVIPTNLDFKTASYVEPVCASMAVLKAHINKEQVGGVYGNNRIAQLTYIILQSFGYNVQWLDEKEVYPLKSFDYIVETLFEEKKINTMLSLLKDNGLLIVKSRKKQSVPINPGLLVAKEITLQAVNYYDYTKTMSWLENNQHLVTDLLGDSYHINDWEMAFDQATSGESKKIFIHF